MKLNILILFFILSVGFLIAQESKREVDDKENLVTIAVDNKEVKMKVDIVGERILQQFIVIDKENAVMLDAYMQEEMKDFVFTLEDVEDGDYMIVFFFDDDAYREHHKFSLKRENKEK